MEEEVSCCLRLLTLNARSAAPGGALDTGMETALAESLGRLHKFCSSDNSSSTDHLERVLLPGLSQTFLRTAIVTPPTQTGKTLLFAVLRFYLQFGAELFHEGEAMLHAFFRLFLIKQFGDLATATASLAFLVEEKERLVEWHPVVLPQYFPLMLKLAVCHCPWLDRDMEELLPVMVAPASFLPLFPTLLDLPILAMALEDFEMMVGALPGALPSSVPKPPAPEDVFALMDSFHTGGGAPALRGESSEEVEEMEEGRGELRALFKDLMKDENAPLAMESHWTSPRLSSDLTKQLSSSKYSERIQAVASLALNLLQVYVAVAIRDVDNDDENEGGLLHMLLLKMFHRIDKIFPDTAFTEKVQEVCIQAMLEIFQRSPELLVKLKKPIVSYITKPFEGSFVQANMAQHLCWVVGEYSSRLRAHRGDVREIYEGIELLVYENIATCVSDARGLPTTPDATRSAAALGGKYGRARLLSLAITAIAKIGQGHPDLAARTEVCLAKVLRSASFLAPPVVERAADFLGLIRQPLSCTFAADVMMGAPPIHRLPPGSGREEGDRADTEKHFDLPSSSLPLYLLKGHQGLPFFDFSLDDVVLPPPVEPLVAV
eukprot:TRINITY_DN7867_c0_g1_i1.p1 TRINITY_DN7867_c0_g1~~TRINITY_DN7867_c0_g1_i1.p1  ORF type:complete len:603 (+),score=123.93 TRINITY_DN7867_c0_g1_i1:318-2126(+)